MNNYPFPPYAHQERARDAVLSVWAEGKRDTYLQMATGVGKTEACLFILSEISADSRILYLAHREELVTQPLERLLKDWTHIFGVPGVVKAELNEYKRRFTIASVPTLKNPKRLKQLLSAGAITHVVVDECHHVRAPSYITILDGLREANPNLYHLGLTATPHRTDKDPLSKTYDCRAFSYPIVKAIKDGALCPFVAYSVKMEGVSIRDVAEREDSWDDEKMGEVMSFANAEKLILESWEERCKGQQTILFCPSVMFAHSVAQKFREAGYAFVAIDGKTESKERKAGLDGLKNGKIMGIANFGVCTEGFDAPRASACLVARPVKSDLIYVQMIGRVLRNYPGKEFATILDFAPVDGRDMVMAGDVTGKPRKQREMEQKATDDGVIGVWGIDSKGEGIDGDPDHITMALLDYFQTSRLNWYYQKGWSIASVDSGAALAIRTPDPVCEERLVKAEQYKASGGEWTPAIEKAYQVVKAGAMYRLWYVKRAKGQKPIVDNWGLFDSWERARDAADGWVLENGTNALSEKGRAWRNKEASEGQMGIIRKNGLEDALLRAHDGKISRGIASKVISWIFTRQTLKKYPLTTP